MPEPNRINICHFRSLTFTLIDIPFYKNNKYRIIFCLLLLEYYRKYHLIIFY
jgi:hypothetical protein